MKQFDCDLYMDLMPLVKDGAASLTSRKALEEHMSTCESCSELFKSFPETAAQPDTDAIRTLQKLRRRFAVSAWVAMLAVVVIGGVLTMTENMGYNIILFPLVGTVALFALDRQVWKGAVAVTCFSFLWLLIRLLTVFAPVSGSEFGTALLFSVLYGLSFLLGAWIAWLVRYTFRKPVDGKRAGHIGSGVLAVVLCVGFVTVLNFFVGNPFSYSAARSHSQAYVQERYPDMDLEVSNPEYDWYSSPGYYVRVSGVSSDDTEFMLYYDQLGRFSHDEYENWVQGGMNTFSRISTEYTMFMADVCAELQDDLAVSVTCDLASDHPSIYDGVDYPFHPAERIIRSQLTVDGDYDSARLGARYGKIDLWGQTASVSEEEICGLLLKLKETLDTRGIIVATVDVHIFDEEDNSLRITGFPYEAIGGADFEELVHSYRVAWDEFQVVYDAYIEERNAE